VLCDVCALRKLCMLCVCVVGDYVFVVCMLCIFWRGVCVVSVLCMLCMLRVL